MLGVDLADQLISYYRSKLRCRRTWMPIFLHCLDVLRINAYILYREMNKKRGNPIPKKYCHKKFVLGLIDSLITRGELAEEQDSPQKSKRPTAAAPIKEPVSCVEVPQEERTLIRFDKKNPSLTKFDHLRFKVGEHNRVKAKQNDCKYCSYLKLKYFAEKEKKGNTSNEDDFKPHVTKPKMKCSDCKVNLCKDHFDLWHSKDNN